VVKRLSDKLHDLDLRTRIIMATPVEDNGSHSSNSSTRPEFVLKDKNHKIQSAYLAPLAVPRTRKSQDAQAPNPMARAVHHAGDQYDVVLIDASPLPISANTEYLARVADATVLVVKSSSTTRQELDRAARLLDRLEVTGVAVVLNKVSQERADNALKMELARYKQSFRHP
jgi:MinD superfamily P-loop ATPase